MLQRHYHYCVTRQHGALLRSRHNYFSATPQLPAEWSTSILSSARGNDRRSSAEGESVENDGQHVLADLQGRALRELDRVAIWDSALDVLGRGPAGALHGAPRVELRELELNAGLRDAALVKGWQNAERGQAQKYIECASVLNRAVDVPSRWPAAGKASRRDRWGKEGRLINSTDDP